MDKRILVVAAHPDDEVLGCGGTLSRLAADGAEVFISIFGEGITSRSDKREDADPGELKALRAKAEQVKEILGARRLQLFDLPDNRFDSVPLLEIVKKIESLLQEFRPIQVFTHHPSDLNIDHQVLHQAVVTATRPLAGSPVKEVYAFETLSATEWGFDAKTAFRPNVFFDISRTLETKVKAVSVYASEMRVFPHPRSAEAIRALAALRGSAAGVRAAEAFELVRAVR